MNKASIVFFFLIGLVAVYLGVRLHKEDGDWEEAGYYLGVGILCVLLSSGAFIQL